MMALIIGLFTFLGIWIFAVADAYNMVRKQNDEIRSNLGVIDQPRFLNSGAS
jgi:hypothetical protein